jgi:hypothetical protein
MQFCASGQSVANMRHTFARRLLQDGNSIDEVVMALGDDPKTVALHYSAWVPAAGTPDQNVQESLQGEVSDQLVLLTVHAGQR